MQVNKWQYFLIVGLWVHKLIVKVDVETGVVIDLKNPSLEILIKQDIESKHLKSFALELQGWARTVVDHIWQHLHDSLATEPNAFLDLRGIVSLAFQVFVKSRQSLLCRSIWLQDSWKRLRLMNVVFAHFVDWVIG